MISKNEVFYLDKGKIEKEPSTLVDLTKKEIKILRKGADLSKLKNLQKLKSKFKRDKIN